jgi:hypothetical protein
MNEGENCCILLLKFMLVEFITEPFTKGRINCKDSLRKEVYYTDLPPS